MKSRLSLSHGAMARAGLALALAVAVCVLALGAHARLAHAQASLVVSDCTSDSQLQADVAQANGDNAGDTITFSCSGTISLSQTLAITGSMTLDGSGQQVTLDGGNSVRVLLVNSGVTFTLNALTIAHGNGSSRVGVYGGGGGLFSQLGATVTITNSTFTGNSTSGDGGGAIFNDGAMTLTSSTVSGNSFSGAGNEEGGGLLNNYDYGTRTAATATLTNSTFTGNSAGFGGGIFNTGKMTLTNNTISGNSGGYGGGFYNNDAVTFANNIVAGNSAVGGDNCYFGVAYLVTDAGYNLESGTDCRFTGTGSLQNTNPMLAAGLANNGGPTQTIALLSGSPAIDQIPAASCPATDQRGITRPDKGETSCDIGAYEYVDPDQDLSLSQPGNITASATSAQGATIGYTMPTASDESGDTSAPVVSCLPASGTTFALGATTVTCTATDADDVNSPVSVNFTIYVDSVNLSSYPTLPNGAPNLSNANLSGAYLGGANLAGASLVSGNFSNANLTGANLSGANLTSARLSGATLTNANLSGANLASGNFSGANFSGANLTNATLTSSNLKNANFSGADLAGATGMSSAALSGAVWSNTTCPDNTNSGSDGGTCLNNLA